MKKIKILLLLVLLTNISFAQTCKCKCHKNRSNNYKKQNEWKVVGTRMTFNSFYIIYKNNYDEFYEKEVSVGVYDYYYRKTHPEQFKK